MTDDGVPLPVVDLVDRLRLGLARGGPLLDDDERAMVARILALTGEPALLFARLVSRVPVAFRLTGLAAAGVEDVAGAAAALVEDGLATLDVAWATRLAEASSDVLAAGCRALGLPVTGSKAVLRARLEGREGWDDAPWLALPARPLVVRLERWATLAVTPDRAGAVLERLGRLRWMDYPLTEGGALVPDRASWLAWEAVVDAGDALTVADALDALDRPSWPPGGLDVRGELRWRIGETARTAERAGDHATAEALYAALLARGAGAGVAVRRARVRELAGDREGALGLLATAREEADAVDRIAVIRAGRRLARDLGRSWPPDPPLARPEVRRVALARGEAAGSRPRYVEGDLAMTVEEAVRARLARAGRTAVHAEGGLWRTLLSLLLGPALFAPVAGQLPVPRLPGPLDAETPAFAARRPDAVWALVDDVAAGRAGARLRQGIAWIDGRVTVGVEAGLVDGDVLGAIVDGLGPAGLLAVLRPLLAGGRRAAAGLPDLVVLPGPEARVEGLHPGRLGGGALLVEVKGEQDTERDAQRVWFDRLRAAGVAVEVWKVAG